MLVNNAGSHEDALLATMPPDSWRRVLATNLDGVFHGCQAVLPTMISQRGGRIVNVSSLSALLAPAGQANYAAAKAGVVALTQSLAKEVARIGITVNAVCPGFVETEALAASGRRGTQSRANENSHAPIWPAGRSGGGGPFSGRAPKPATSPAPSSKLTAEFYDRSMDGKVIIIGGRHRRAFLRLLSADERHPDRDSGGGALPGGLCTAWHRGPYVFDGCLRWLMGTHPPSAFHQIWTELGAIAGRKIFIHDEILRIEWPDGTSLRCRPIWMNLAAEFKRFAPEDCGLIEQLVRDARRCAPLEPPLEKPVELMTSREKIRLGLRFMFDGAGDAAV